MSTTPGAWSPAPGNTNVPAGGATPAAPAAAPVVPAAPGMPVDTRTVQGKWTPGATAEDGGTLTGAAATAPRGPSSHVEGTWTPAAAAEEPEAPAAPRTPATGAIIPEVKAGTPATGAAIPEPTPAAPAAPATPATGAVIPDPLSIVWTSTTEGFATEAPVRVGPKSLERAYLLVGTPGAWTLSATTKGGAARGSQVAPAAVGDADHAKAWAEGVIRSGWTGAGEDGA